MGSKKTRRKGKKARAGKTSKRPHGDRAAKEAMDALRTTQSWKYAAALAAYEEAMDGGIDKRYGATLGIDTGSKIVHGEVTDSPCLRFFVSKKLPKKKLERSNRIPSNIDGVPTDVVATRIDTCSGGIQGFDRIRPEHDLGSPGRVGTMVRDVDKGGKMLLTAAHVVQGGGKLSVLENAVKMVDDDENVVGRFLTGRGMNWQRNEHYDSGLLRPEDGGPEAKAFVRGHEGVPLRIAHSWDLRVGANLFFPVTDETIQSRHGQIDSLFNTFTLTNGEHVTNHIVVKRTSDQFARQGHSGGLVVDSENRAVGIIRAVLKTLRTNVRDDRTNLTEGEPQFALIVPMYRIVGRFRVWPTNE